MKKLILLSAAGLLSFGAIAQQAKQSVVRPGGDDNAKITAAPLGGGQEITQSRHHNTAKVAASAFYTENFGSGTRTTLPTGWTATAGAGLSATWHWTNTAATGTYGLGALNSTTKANGWMIYDSDSIGSLHPTVLPLTGALISPTINCATHSSVLVSFESYYRKFRDSTYVDVSINGGTSWTTFPVLANNAMGDNTTNTNNPTIVRINITSVAANQSNVKLRFRYIINVNSGVGGTFNWLVDDVALAEIDPVELGIHNSQMFLYNGGANEYSNYSLFSNYPLSLIDSLIPITYLDNNGLNSMSNVVLNAKVFLGTTQVYNQNHTFTNIPANGLDSIVDWFDVPSYNKPSAIGAYTAAFSINPTGDGFTANNIDTARFNITDTVLTTYGPTIAGGYYIHRPNTNAAGELSYQMGVRFDIPANKKDTLTTVSVSYDDDTNPGVNTIAQLYKISGTAAAGLNWTPVASFRAKVLTAAMISTSTTRVYTDYVANTAGGITPFILDAGTYAVIVKTIGAAANTTVTINAAVPINTKVSPGGYFGQADSSDNIAGYSFSPIGIATGLTSVPLIRVNFGRFAPDVPKSVATINGVMIGDAYPNPANNTLNIPVSATAGANINVSLSNMMGQVLQTQSLGNMSAGQSRNAVFNTSGITSGIYLCTVESNGERVTTRVVVAH